MTTNLDGHSPPDVGDACVVAVHRIIQEALTNVVRYAGSVSVTVSMHHRADGVRVQIVNRPGMSPRDAVPSTGVGVIGMSERAATLGGTLRAGPTEAGGFEVDATIPYHRRPPSSEHP